MTSKTSLCAAVLASLAGAAHAAQVTGPSSSASPYLVPAPGAPAGINVTSILTVGDTVSHASGSGTYRMVGIPDGLGAYDNGDGVEQDPAKAVYWYQKAVDQGDKDAQFNLAIMYENGTGVTRSYKKAFALYLQSAEQGDMDAEFEVGESYAKGRGVAKNPAQARAWYQKAADQGHEEAEEKLAAMPELPPSI